MSASVPSRPVRHRKAPPRPLLLAGTVLPGLFLAAVAQANPITYPSTDQLNNYLIIGTTRNAEGRAVNIQNTEIGADRAFLSNSTLAPNTANQAAPNTRDVFWQNGDRWPSFNAPPPGAAGVFVGTDWSGNVAVTSPTGQFNLSNVDVYANLGVHCASSASGCTNSGGNTSNSYYFANNVAGPGAPPGVLIGDPAAYNGVSQQSFATLGADMVAWEQFINSLGTEHTITQNIENQNAKDGVGPAVLNVSLLDTNNDGLAVINIDRGGSDFELNNSDWILQGDPGTLAIFRVVGNSNFNVSNSSILLGNGGIGGTDDTGGIARQIGAIFYKNEPGSGDQTFKFNNTVLNGVAFWDLTGVRTTGLPSQLGFNDAEKTTLTVNNGQGCAQFIAPRIDFNDVRFNHCALVLTTDIPTDPNAVPAPASLGLFAIGIAGLCAMRRRRPAPRA